MRKFNVLEYSWRGQVQPYDVLPYFRNTWHEKRFNFGKKNVKTRADLRAWIERASKYMYWARCEYEFIMLPWPYNTEHPTKDAEKIDVHYQIMMNIDVIADILAEEFKLFKS